jgi:hypothetical protein
MDGVSGTPFQRREGGLLFEGITSTLSLAEGLRSAFTVEFVTGFSWVASSTTVPSKVTSSADVPLTIIGAAAVAVNSTAPQEVESL